MLSRNIADCNIQYLTTGKAFNNLTRCKNLEAIIALGDDIVQVTRRTDLLRKGWFQSVNMSGRKHAIAIWHFLDWRAPIFQAIGAELEVFVDGLDDGFASNPIFLGHPRICVRYVGTVTELFLGVFEREIFGVWPDAIDFGMSLLHFVALFGVLA